MSTSQKFYYRCVECGHKTSSTNKDRAAAKVCVNCRPDLDAKPATKKTVAVKTKAKLSPAARSAKAAPRSCGKVEVMKPATILVAPIVEECVSSAIPSPAPVNPATVEASAKPRKPSALYAAAQVLRDTGEALSPKDIWREIQERGLWISPKGKTPYGTIASAMLREWKALGDKSRFLKTEERGKFAANPGVA